MEYLILRDIDKQNPKVEIDTDGRADKFKTYSEAKKFAEKWEVPNYSIVAVCDDKRNYLV